MAKANARPPAGICEIGMMADGNCNACGEYSSCPQREEVENYWLSQIAPKKNLLPAVKESQNLI